MLLLCF
jgi:hypothetical protein